MSSNTAALRSEIKIAFGEVGLKKIDPSTMSQCVSLALQLRVTPKQMATSWEAFSVNKNVKALTEKSFGNYRTALIKDSDSMDVVLQDVDHHHGAIMTTQANNNKRDNNDSDSTLPHVTPPAKRLPEDRSSFQQNPRRVSLSPGPPVASTSSSRLPTYAQRPNVGKVMASYSPPSLVDHHNNNNEPPTTNTCRCRVSWTDFTTTTNVSTAYRHLFTTLEERSKALDQRVNELGAAMTELYQLGMPHDDDEPNNERAPLEGVGVARQDMVCCIGRICNAAHEGRINATSVLLEGSRHTSGGARVPVDLSHLTAAAPYSLFPGQVVAVEGMNPTGRQLVAHRICHGAAPATATTTVQELYRYHHNDEYQGGRPLSIMAVAGPFTTSDNLEYEPLLDLVNTIRETKPDVVILMGPFVDVRHQAVQSGQTTLQFEDSGEAVLVPYEAFFANKIALLLEELFHSDEKLTTQFVLVPSLDDATAEWVYPQPPMSDRIAGGMQPDIPGADGITIGSLGLGYVESAGGRTKEDFRRVHCVSNPCTLKINELVIGVTSTDVLFHMSTDETNANLEPGSRLVRISQHMIEQRSYYPLFPAAPGINLDLKRMQQWEMPCTPDLLIIPSRLALFAKTVLDSTIVVNPGYLTRDTTGGTYATIDVHPIKRETLENAGGDNVELKHAVHERTRVEIKKI